MEKHQRVKYEDALIVLQKNIDGDQDKLHSATTYVEDYAGGSSQYIRRDVVEKVIKKLTN